MILGVIGGWRKEVKKLRDEGNGLFVHVDVEVTEVGKA